MRSRTVAAIASLALLGTLVAHEAPGAALASDVIGTFGPEVALLATRPSGTTTSLYLTRPGDPSAPAPVATFSHLEGAVVRGTTVPGTDTVLAVADTSPARDASFAASIFRIAPHEPPALLCDRVVHASRPLVTASGKVFVSRGTAGPELAGGSLRIDALTIDEVDRDTGATSTMHAFSGYLTFLAGSFRDEVLLYRVGPGGADIVAFDATSGTLRVVLASVPPYARDFSVDEARGMLWFEDRHETDSRRWVVDRVDLVSGARTRIHESASMSLAPHAWPGGGVALNPDGRSGLALLGTTLDVRHPLGGGVDLALAESAGGAYVAFLHTLPSRLPVPFTVDTATGEASRIATPDGTRVTIAGFVPDAGGAP